MALTSATHDSSVNSTVFDQNLYWFHQVSSIASLGMRDKQCCLREVFREKKTGRVIVTDVHGACMAKLTLNVINQSLVLA